MFPTNVRPSGPGGSGNACRAAPRSLDLARSKASNVVKMHPKIEMAAMARKTSERKRLDLGVCVEREDGDLLCMSR
jgi:hypothetical protein